MMSAKERSVVTEAEEVYLDHMKFRGKHHDTKFREIMSRELEHHKAPVPRPTRAHTFDFNLLYKGARLLDGECKGTVSEHKKAILVFHSLDQLAFKDEALALLTTNNSFIFYSSWLVDRPNYMLTCFYELRKFKLRPVANIKVDLEKDAEHLQTPPHFMIKGDGQEFVETDTNILKVWKSLRSKVRQFMCTIMHAVNILAEAVSGMGIEKISQWQKMAYKVGWVELNFHSGDTSDLKNRCKIRNQEDYMYSRKNMEGEEAAEYEQRTNQELYQGFKDILESDVEMSSEIRAAIEFSVNHHKPPNA